LELEEKNKKVYCNGCGILLTIKKSFFDFSRNESFIEFEDGYYCMKCAKIRVDDRSIFEGKK